MPIVLPDEARKDLVTALQGYFRDERGEEIGGLQASFLLDFVLKEIAPSVYNQAIRDAQSCMQAAVVDLDLTLHEPESGSATPRRRGR